MRISDWSSDVCSSDLDEDSETGEHFNLDGYRLGAGVEQKVGSNAYAKVEYRYSNYGDARLEFANGGNTDNFSVDTDRHQVVAGVGWRFWSPARRFVTLLKGRGACSGPFLR